MIKNLYHKALDNLKHMYQLEDQLTPDVKYGIAPANYMSTEPRFEKRPDSQATSASKMNSSMAPNPQAGTELSGDRTEKQPDYEPSYIGGLGDSEKDDSFYRQDPRIKQANREVRVDGLGYIATQFAGAESAFDTPAGPYDRDPGEVNSPVVYGSKRAYQGSAERYTHSPEQELGGSNFGPVESMYQGEEMTGPDSAHENVTWIETHPNAVTQTLGDHPFKHEDRHYHPVEFATSVGDRGVR